MRPHRLAIVLGTATGVGKTWMTAGLARELRARAVTVAARKPVQSYSPTDPATDADVLGDATGEHPDSVCPAHRWYPVARAPPMAADALGRPAFTIADLVGEVTWPTTRTSVGLVETVGGPRSPTADDGDSVDLAAALRPDLIVLIADAGLGTINAVRLAAAACSVASAPLVVILNRFDAESDLHRGNLARLTTDGFDVLVEMSHLVGRLTP